MVWFKVDDKLHSHPKAAAASLAALGLWAVAGSWCGDHTTDGRVPEHMVRSLSRGSVELADELVSCGLWTRTRDGYRFHQWVADGDGTKRNPSRKEVEEDRRKKAAAGRLGGQASAATRRGKSFQNHFKNNPQAAVDNAEGGDKPATTSGKTRSTRQAGASARASPLVEPPTRPFASNEAKRVGGAPAARGGPRPDQCPRHRGQPADNCGLCRSEQLAERPR